MKRSFHRAALVLAGLSTLCGVVGAESPGDPWQPLFTNRDVATGFRQLGGKAVYELKDGVLTGTSVTARTRPGGKVTANSEPLPSTHLAWDEQSPAPGLLAASHDLSATRLLEAYSHGIFPWFSEGQPVLWWSPDPRMVLQAQHFRFHRSLRQTMKRWLNTPGFSLSFDKAFSQVMRRCSAAPRPGQSGTWIVPAMVTAYEDLHRAGHAHSAEVWLHGELVAGLYFVALGHAVFGESMFSRADNASKVGFVTLVRQLHSWGFDLIDCQMPTQHLHSFGARAISREAFAEYLRNGLNLPTNANWRAWSGATS